MLRFGSRSFSAVALAAIAVLSWSGCATTQQQSATPPTTVAPEGPIDCCPIPDDPAVISGAPTGYDCWSDQLKLINDENQGYEAHADAWLNRETGEYCAEENGAVRFPGGELIKGPRKGTFTPPGT